MSFRVLFLSLVLPLTFAAGVLTGSRWPHLASPIMGRTTAPSDVNPTLSPSQSPPRLPSMLTELSAHTAELKQRREGIRIDLREARVACQLLHQQGFPLEAPVRREQESRLQALRQQETAATELITEAQQVIDELDNAIHGQNDDSPEELPFDLYVRARASLLRQSRFGLPSTQERN